LKWMSNSPRCSEKLDPSISPYQPLSTPLFSYPYSPNGS